MTEPNDERARTPRAHHHIGGYIGRDIRGDDIRGDAVGRAGGGVSLFDRRPAVGAHDRKDAEHFNLNLSC
ncbi:MAG TPA: hypothetical protein VNO51_02105 [Ilumatobacteraceae bacterium]|nr:hypothetical protein [Ilumatobacteraceae bacterium]